MTRLTRTSLTILFDPLEKNDLLTTSLAIAHAIPSGKAAGQKISKVFIAKIFIAKRVSTALGAAKTRCSKGCKLFTRLHWFANENHPILWTLACRH